MATPNLAISHRNGADWTVAAAGLGEWIKVDWIKFGGWWQCRPLGSIYVGFDMQIVGIGGHLIFYEQTDRWWGRALKKKKKMKKCFIRCQVTSPGGENLLKNPKNPERIPWKEFLEIIRIPWHSLESWKNPMKKSEKYPRILKESNQIPRYIKESWKNPIKFHKNLEESRDSLGIPRILKECNRIT